MVTDQQVLLLSRRIMEGKTQQASAAAAGMSSRSARSWSGPLPIGEEEAGERARSVCRSVGRGELRSIVQATVLIEWLDERHPGRFNSSHLRTLQRRIRVALSGPDREVDRASRPDGLRVRQSWCDDRRRAASYAVRFILSHSGWRYAQGRDRRW